MGRVLAQGTELTCTDTCIATVPRGTTVVLVADTAAGAVFTGWQGGGCENTARCPVTVTSDVTVDARFDLATFIVAVRLSGDGGGTVATPHGDLSCPDACTLTLPYNAVVTLDAHPGTNSTFQGWEGVCTGTGACSILVRDNVTATAMFVANKALNIEFAGNGSGLVTSNPEGIQCSMNCSASYPPGTTVALSASAAGDSVFTGWSGGACSGTGTCTVVIRDSVSVTATFALKKFSLTINRTGDGNGTVISDPVGVACDTECLGIYDAHTVVVLTASPGVDSLFTGWIDGPCSGSGPCVVTMDAATTVGASFGLTPFGLTVTRTGGGNGTVTSDIAGITCGPDCTESYPSGTAVTLTAVADGDSTFTGWSGGGCAGTGTCTVVIGGTTSIAANFEPARFILTVINVGRDGSGVVISSPAGILCGTDCSESYVPGASVTLTASAGPGSVFTGWSGGACTGVAPCRVRMTSAVTVTASFSHHAILYVTSNHPSEVLMFETTADGERSPIGKITGTDTTFQRLAGITVTSDEIYVVDDLANAIDVFPVNSVNNVAPIRRIRGPATGLSRPNGVMVLNREIYVAQQSGSVVVFPVAANGNIPPTRSITGFQSAMHLATFIDELYVTDSIGSRILVMPVSASGPVTPIRTIVGTNTFLNGPAGIAISNDRIFVSDLSNRLLTFQLFANGNATPTNITLGADSQLAFPTQLSALGTEIFISCTNGNRVVIYPQTLGARPIRQIAGPGTLLHDLGGAFAF